MVADFIGETMHPGSDVFVKEIRRVVVDVNPVQPTSSQAILMGMKRLEDLMEIVWGKDLLEEDPSFFTLAVPSPRGILLADAVV